MEKFLHSSNELLDVQAEGAATHYRLYKMRWFIVFVSCALQLVNTMLWFGLAPVANYTDEYYEVEGASNWLSLFYIITVAATSPLSMWLTRKNGVRFALLASAGSQALGAGVRFGSSWLPSHSRLAVTLCGQAIAASTSPCLAYMATKVAAVWCGENERTLATSIMGMSRPFGILFVNALAPALITRVGSVFHANALLFALACGMLVCAAIGVRHSDPPSPPTRSASKPRLTFWIGLKRCLTNINFFMLAIPLGGGIGWFNAIYTTSQQLFCPLGYSNVFIGIVNIVMITAGVTGAILAGIFLDRTKLYDETLKTVVCIGTIFGIFLAVAALRANFHALILIFAGLFGFFGMAGYPSGLQMAIETTYPVDETTSTGFVFLLAQVSSMCFIMVLTKLKQPLASRFKYVQVCTVLDTNKVVEAHDMKLAVMVISGIGFILVCILIGFFKPTYERRKQDAAKEENTCKDQIGETLVLKG